MRIAFITDWFSHNMGYAENCLPRAMVMLGHEVHVLSSNAQIYYNSPEYAKCYESFIGPPIVPCGVSHVGGFTLHRLPLGHLRGRLRIRGLVPRLNLLRPDVIQTFDVLSWTTLEASVLTLLRKCPLFVESHLHASVCPLATGDATLRHRLGTFVLRQTVGRLVDRLSSRCYPVSTDAADIAVRFLGTSPEKVSICSLGVDTELFCPAAGPEAEDGRARVRAGLGIGPDEIVCIYTGRFTASKNPLCLADAVAVLVSEGRRFRGLFVGMGPQAEEIAKRPGCIVHPFVPFRELPALYRASDVGVWPRQESTSQLDAAACGLPLVLSNRVEVVERVEGNGLLYEEDDAADLARRLLTLQDPERRREMGRLGTEKVQQRWSWLSIARQRVGDYEKALEAMGRSRS